MPNRDWRSQNRHFRFPECFGIVLKFIAVGI